MESEQPPGLGETQRKILTRLAKPLASDQELGNEPDLGALLAVHSEYVAALHDCILILAAEIDRLRPQSAPPS